MIAMIVILFIAMLISLGGMVFWVWTLIDCLGNKYLTDNKRTLWMILIVFLGLIGSLTYFFAGRSPQTSTLLQPYYAPQVPQQSQAAQTYRPYQEGYRAQPVPRTHHPNRAVPASEREAAQQVQNEHIQISYPE